MREIKLFGTGAILLLVVLFTVVNAQAVTIDVPDDYGTIQDAVNAAGSGDTINVSSGIYNGNVVVDKANLKIIGIGNPECRGVVDAEIDPLDQNAFTITASGVWLEGFHITSAPNNCVRIEPEGFGTEIHECHIEGWQGVANVEGAIGGIRVEANDVIIQGCIIDGIGGWNKDVRFEGVAVRDVTNFTFIYNTVKNVTYVQSFWPNCGIRFCALEGGLGLRGDLLVDNNTFENNEFALSCDNNGSSLSDCVIIVSENFIETEVVEASSDIWTGGLVLYEFAENSGITAILERNEILGPSDSNGRTIGILVGEIAGGDVTIKNNFISDIDLGVSSYWSSYETVGADGIKVYNNTLFKCKVRGLDLDSSRGLSTDWNVRNNIIDMDAEAQGAYAIYVPSGKRNKLNSDYNDLHVSGGYIGYWGSKPPQARDVATLTEWQQVSGGDANSTGADPAFLSAGSTPDISTDSPCVDAGQVILSVTDDFYGSGGIARTGNKYDIGAHEAVFTEIVDTTPPVITNIASAVTSNSATITWVTDEASNSLVEYGPTTGYGLDKSDSAFVTDHSVTLADLTASTEYHYKVTSVDAALNSASSGDLTFETLAESDNPMYVSDISMSLKEAGPNVNAVATVTIADVNGAVQGATVYGHWDGLTSDTDEGITDILGKVSLNSDKLKTPVGTFTFTVDDVIKDGWTYNPGLNVEPSDSIDCSAAPARAYQNNAEEPYPNPANPGIWMPFTLSETERVVIRIYDATGRHVRTLDLGQKAPGAYISKDKAAYWDGKTESGESVASGTYFYMMEAGKFRNVKKLIIMR